MLRFGMWPGRWEDPYGPYSLPRFFYNFANKLGDKLEMLLNFMSFASKLPPTLIEAFDMFLFILRFMSFFGDSDLISGIVSIAFLC